MADENVTDQKFMNELGHIVDIHNQYEDQYKATVQKITSRMSKKERNTAVDAASYGYGPLAFLRFPQGTGHLAFGGEMQPGMFRSVHDRKIANPAPLGFCGFALSTFVLSLINVGTLNLKNLSILVCLGFVYGGLIQILSGMWEMAIGNTFGATTFTSYGAFWISYALLIMPSKSLNIMEAIKVAEGGYGELQTVGLYYMGWFVFTTLMTMLTLKSTIAMFLLFFSLDLCYLFSGVSYLYNDGNEPQAALLRVSGAFGLVASFSAWYNAFSGVADNTNSLFVLPALHFPWTSGSSIKKLDESHIA